MLRKLAPSVLQPVFQRVWKSKCRALEYHETWPLVFFDKAQADQILPQSVRSYLAHGISPSSLNPRQGDMVGQATRLKEQLEAGRPHSGDFRSVALLRQTIMMEDAKEREISSEDSLVASSSDFMAQVSDELALHTGGQRHNFSLGLNGRCTNKWLVDENLHGMEEVPGSYMGRGPSFLMQEAWAAVRDQQRRRDIWLQSQITHLSSLPPLERSAEIGRLLHFYRAEMERHFQNAALHRRDATLDDLLDTSLFGKMAGLNDRDVLNLSIARGCAVVVSKDRNPGQDTDGLCRLHLNRAIEVMDMLERIEMGAHSSVYPYVLHTMPMIVLPIVPEVKGNLRLAEELVLSHADEIGKLAASKTVPLIKVTVEGGVEAFGEYRLLRNWQGNRSAAEYKDSDELISRLGHFANGEKFFRRSKFKHLEPVGQALGLVRC